MPLTWPLGRLLPLTCLAAAAALAPSTSAKAMFRGDAAHSGHFEGNGPAALKGVKWAFKTGGAVVSSPVLAGGTVFVGSDDRNLYAIDAAIGTEKWKFATEGAVRSTPAVSDGVVYVASYDGMLYAVEAGTGKQKWKFETEGERKFTAPGLHGLVPKQQLVPDPWDCYLSSPVVAAGRVYFGSGDGHVYAVEAQTGKLAWKFATGNVVHASPAIAGDTVYIGSWDTYFYALNAATGELRWKFKTGADPVTHNAEGIQASATVVDGVVYFGCRDFHLYALDAEKGTELWKHKYTWVNATPTVRDGRVYGGTSIPAYFFALDAKTGEELYKVDVKVPVFSSPAVTADRAYFGSFSGILYAVDLTTQKIAWEFRTEASRQNARQVLLQDGTLNYKSLFPTNHFEQMFASMDALFSIGAVLSSPWIEGDTVYAGSTDGNVYALN